MATYVDPELWDALMVLAKQSKVCPPNTKHKKCTTINKEECTKCRVHYALKCGRYNTQRRTFRGKSIYCGDWTTQR